MYCCNQNCRQGRDCPKRKNISLRDMLFVFQSEIAVLSQIALVLAGLSILIG